MRTLARLIPTLLLALAILAPAHAAPVQAKPTPAVHSAASPAKPAATALFAASDDFRWGFIDKTGKIVSSGFEEAGDYSEGLAPVKVRGQYGYADASGKVVIQPAFDFAGKFSGGLAPVKVGKLWGYIDTTGKSVIEPKFSGAFEFSEGLATIIVDDKYGAIDKTGAYVIQPTYENMGKLSDGMIAVLTSGKWGYIDKTGATAIAPQFDKAGSFVNGVAPAMLDRRWGFIHKTGKWVVEAKYDDAQPFSDGLAAVGANKTTLVHKDGKVIAMKRFLVWGYIDSTGKEVIPIQFKSAGAFSDGLAPVSKGNLTGFIETAAGFPLSEWRADEFSFIDKTGKSVLVPLYNDQTGSFYGGLAKTHIGQRYGFIDEAGKMAIPQRYATATPFADGLAAVQTHPGGVWGYMDQTGKTAIEPQFQKALNFHKNLARVELDYKWGLIDKTGKIALKPQFDEIAWYSDKLVAVKQHGLWGFYDWSGKAILDPQFDSASFLGDNQAIVTKGGKYGVVDATGKLVVEPQYEDCGWLYAQGLLPVCTNGKWGFIDATGKSVIDPQYDAAAGFTSEGLCAVKAGDKWGFIDTTGKMAIAPQYDLATCFSEGRAAVRSGDQWGFIDKTGAYIVKPQYSDAGYFSSGLAPVSTGDKWGYIDKTGSLVIPAKLDRAAAFTNSLAQLRKGRRTGYIDKSGKAVWMSRDYGENVVKAPVSEPPQIDSDGVRTVKVRLAPDQLELQQPDWESAARQRIAGASDILMKAKIRLEIVGTTSWESPEIKNGEDPDDYGTRMFDAMCEKAPAEASELVIGITGRPTLSRTLGFTYPFCNHVFLYNVPDSTVPPAMVTAHEICHTFGAFHVAPKDSLLTPYAVQGMDQTNIDQYTARQLEVMHDFDHAKGVDSLTKDQIDKTAADFADGHMSGDSFCVIQALVGRGLQLINTDLPGAITEFRKASQVQGQAPDFMLIGRLGEALLLDGQLVQATEMFRKTEPLTLEQTIAAKGHRLMGGKLEDLLTDEIAYIACQQPTKPALPEIYERRVRARASAEEMLAQYREAVKAEPENDYSHYRLGKALLLCGKSDEGLAEYQQALTLKPASQWYRDQLEMAKEEMASRSH